MNALELWATYADHLARLFRGAPSLINARGDSWFAVLTGVPHTDLNQCVLAPGASSADADRVVSLITDTDVPAVVSVASNAAEKATAPLARAELRPAPLPEPLMSCQTRPAADSVRFAVSRVGREAELRTAIAICAEGHAIDRGILARLLARDLSREDDVSTWLAWDGDEPISVVWLTHGDHIGVWEMMTPPAHADVEQPGPCSVSRSPNRGSRQRRAPSSGLRLPADHSTRGSPSTPSMSRQSG
jgi:hypothetical protein